jgi:hypothetical protein
MHSFWIKQDGSNETYDESDETYPRILPESLQKSDRIDTKQVYPHQQQDQSNKIKTTKDHDPQKHISLNSLQEIQIPRNTNNIGVLYKYCAYKTD